MSDKTLVERLRYGSTANGTCTGAENGTCASVVIRNMLDKECESRYVCTTCRNCINETMNKLADAIEREYLPRPRFDDGEPVQFGDAYTDKYGREWKNGIKSLHIDCNGNFSLHSYARGGGGQFEEFETNERVKRPEPEVLDADGVPIHKGEVLYSVSLGSEKPRVASVSPFGGGHRKANGEPTVDYENGLWDLAADLTHKQPDSLERIEEDALMASTDYCDKYGLLDSGCNAEEGDDAVRHCTDCGLTCEKRMINHLLRRQREVLERGHER